MNTPKILSVNGEIVPLREREPNEVYLALYRTVAQPYWVASAIIYTEKNQVVQSLFNFNPTDILIVKAPLPLDSIFPPESKYRLVPNEKGVI